jgi:dienelactone hydrolase
MIPIGWLRAVRGFAAALTVFSAAGAPVNYDEAKVPPYSPPDPLRMEDGRVVTNAAQWREARRPELLGLFRREVYGKPLGRPAAMRFVVDHEDPDAMGGRAIRRDVRMLVGPEPGVAVMKFAVVLPKASSGPAPVFVGVSLFDLAKPYPQPAVALASSGGAAPSPEEHVRAGRATADRILGAGFGFASVDIGLLAPDSATNYWAGAAKAMGRNHGGPPGPEETGALGIWAWGLSRVLDYLETLPEVDSTRVAVIGHSRMGKTALWAAANDERFAMAISNDSGCGGAALRRSPSSRMPFLIGFAAIFSNTPTGRSGCPWTSTNCLRSSPPGRCTSPAPPTTAGPIPRASFCPHCTPNRSTSSSTRVD